MVQQIAHGLGSRRSPGRAFGAGEEGAPSARRLCRPLRGVVDWSLDARNGCRLVVAVGVGLAARPKAVIVVGRGARGRAPGQVVVVGLSNLVQVAATRPVAVEVVVLGRGLVVHTTATCASVEVVVLGEVGVAVEVVVLGRGLVVGPAAVGAGAAVEVVVFGEVDVAVEAVVVGLRASTWTKQQQPGEDGVVDVSGGCPIEKGCVD